MQTFQVTRVDGKHCGKVLLSAPFRSAADALGSYTSALMLAGVLSLSRKGGNSTTLADGSEQLANGWIVRVTAI